MAASSPAQWRGSCLAQTSQEVDSREAGGKDREWGGSKEEREEREGWNGKEGLWKVVLTGSNLLLCSPLQFNSLRLLCSPLPLPRPVEPVRRIFTTTPKMFLPRCLVSSVQPGAILVSSVFFWSSFLLLYFGKSLFHALSLVVTFLPLIPFCWRPSFTRRSSPWPPCKAGNSS